MTIALVLLALPTPRGVSLEGHRVLAIVVTAVLLWATEVVPLAVSSLLVLVLLMISGAVKTPAEALSGFASTVLFFLLGSLTLGAAVVRSGLAERLADAFLRRARGSPLRLTVHLLVALPVFALVMPSAISRNALLVPAYESVFRSLGVDKGHRLAKVVC